MLRAPLQLLSARLVVVGYRATSYRCGRTQTSPENQTPVAVTSPSPVQTAPLCHGAMEDEEVIELAPHSPQEQDQADPQDTESEAAVTADNSDAPHKPDEKLVEETINKLDGIHHGGKGELKVSSFLRRDERSESGQATWTCSDERSEPGRATDRWRVQRACPVCLKLGSCLWVGSWL